MRLWVVFAYFLAACSGPAPEQGQPQLTATQASTHQMELIRKVLHRGYTTSDGMAVRSQSHTRAHYVAARVDGRGTVTPAVWLIAGEADAPSAILSVDSAAARVSRPMLAGGTKAAALPTDSEAVVVRAAIAP